MLDVHRLRLLRELAYRDTIAAVAQALSYTPSAVSQQLAILEREAGVSLLERSGRRVQLTPIARRLVTHTEAILDQLERAESSIAATKAQLTDVLRIGAFPSAARAILPPALAILGHDHPGLEFTVVEADPVVAADLTRTGELDVALTHDYDHVPQPDHPALTSTVVLSESLFLAATQPPDPSGNPVASFRGAAWVLGSPGTLCRLAVERICQAAGFTPQVRHRIDDFPTALALVAAGQGVAIVPRLATVDPPAGLTFTELPEQRRVALTHRRGGEQRPALAALHTVVTRAVADLA
ncbi:LysR family transcriptional regulator [Jiangella sp. DSM 45060]|uniref:LysR family transcriptional regulator n=1 Tax=Jiangella sp. DSM 45060 TaxID=1798224 RepID=UPI00087C357C|nr:LysR family transcriptional regulator [Jiangella sp. DSM 45060]SDT70790.1 DNA-binding transcriptional regulator, LysR family [Jiangella sp. DSM 45060]HEU4511775.1 LysR substrate-binding domain-containing protein [Nocardioidaceae bacterium]